MGIIRNIIEKIPNPIKNKYIITLVFFAFWIIFIDDYNLIKQYQIQKDIDNLEEQKRYYISERYKDSVKLYHLQNTKEEQERFSREELLMRKDEEDVFIIRKKEQ